MTAFFGKFFLFFFKKIVILQQNCKGHVFINPKN